MSGILTLFQETKKFLNSGEGIISDSPTGFKSLEVNVISKKYLLKNRKLKENEKIFKILENQ